MKSKRCELVGFEVGTFGCGLHIMAYTYELDIHCVKCTVKKFHYSKQTWIDWDFDVTHPASDENGIHVAQEDSYGKIIQPFFIAEIAENPMQYLECGDCHIDIIKGLDEYAVEGGAYSKPAI